ncbi:MAG: hypothetical protein OXG26_08945 [Caldilineaceae bacterium]|nr:hypothetical protein [Caldilineaceae bacterium]
MASETPFARAAKQFLELMYLTFSKSSLQPLAKEYGGRLVERQVQEAQAMVQMPSKETAVVWRETVARASEVMNISLDGAMVNIREEGWREVKLVTVSAVRHPHDAMTDSVSPKRVTVAIESVCGMRLNWESSSRLKPVAAVWRKPTI